MLAFKQYLIQTKSGCWIIENEIILGINIIYSDFFNYISLIILTNIKLVHIYV